MSGVIGKLLTYIAWRPSAAPFPVHQLPPQPVPSIGTLSMDKSGAEDKPKRGRWEKRNFLWEGRFEYFDPTTSAGHAKRLLLAYGPMTQHCRPRRPLLSASDYRQEMRKRCESWAEVTGTERAASRVGRTEEVSRCAL